MKRVLLPIIALFLLSLGACAVMPSGMDGDTLNIYAPDDGGSD